MVKKKPLELTYGDVVVGASLEAILFAFYNRCKIVYTRQQPPLRFDKIKDFGIGTSKIDIWNRHVFQLTMGGYIPFEDKIKIIEYLNIDTLKVVTTGENVYHIKFKTLYVFDDHEFYGIPPHIERSSDEVRILDWFKSVNLKTHDIDTISNKSKFMNQVIFFKRNLFKNTKDICVISYANRKKLGDLHEAVVKIKLEGLLKENGIEKNKHSVGIHVEHIKRDIIDLGVNIYENFDNVVFVYPDIEMMYHASTVWRKKIDFMKYFRMTMKVTNDRDEW